MAASSSGNDGPVHGFSKLVSKINEIRTLYGPSDMGITYKNNFGAENDCDDYPLSFMIFFDELRNIESVINTKPETELNIYKSIIEICKIMPGFPGGGRSFIEIPLNTTIMELPNVLEQIRGVIENFRDNFKYGQNTKHYMNFVDSSCDTINEIDFLSCLPENGGSPQIEIGIRYIMKNIFLVIVVDSYWQPSIDLLIETIKLCSMHTSYVNSTSKRKKIDSFNLEGNIAIYEEFKKNLLFKHHGKSNYTLVGKKTCFNIPDFSYCELMGYLHRNAVITKLCMMISKIKINDVKLIDSFASLLTNAYEFPSIIKENAVLLNKEWLYTGDNQIKIQLIDHQFIRNAVHSTIHFVSEPAEDGSNITGIYFSKRIFNIKDFYIGDAFVFYGDNEGGFSVNIPKTTQDFGLMIRPDKSKFIAKKNIKTINNFTWFDENYVYFSRDLTSLSNEGWYISTDIFRSNWTQYTSKDKKKSTQELFGISFEESSDVNMIRLSDDSKEIIPFQLYHDDIGVKMSYKPMVNDFLVESAIHEFLNVNYHMSGMNLSIIPIIFTIKMVKSLEKMKIKELVEMQIKFHEEQESISLRHSKSGKRQIIYCKEHGLSAIRDYFRKHKNGKYIVYGTENDKEYGDTTILSSTTTRPSFTRLYHYCEYEKIQ